MFLPSRSTSALCLVRLHCQAKVTAKALDFFGDGGATRTVRGISRRVVAIEKIGLTCPR